MSLKIKFLFLVLAILAGFFGYILMTIAFVETGVVAEQVFNLENKNTALVHFGGGMWACLLGSLCGVASLFMSGGKVRWFLWAPFYLPMFYLLGMMTYLISG